MNLLRFMRRPISYMEDLHQAYGDVVTLARGTTDYVFVFSAEHNRRVLTDTALFFNLGLESSPLRIPEASALSRLLGGLAQMNGEKHRLHRGLIAPALHRRYIEGSYRDVMAVTEQRVGAWRAGQRRDLFHDMKELTLAIAVKILMGVDPGAVSNTVSQLLERWIASVFSLAAILVPFDLPGLAYRRLLSVSVELEGVIRQLIELRRASSGGRDVLSNLIQEERAGGGRLSEAELIGQIAFLFMAGHATTAAALTWTLFLLDRHPDVLRGIRQELDQARDGLPTWDQLDELRILDAAIKESLRLLPPVLWWSRVATARFDIGPFTLPEGTRVVHSPYITHRNERQYPMPSRFRPQRWLETTPGPFDYLPFSAGPRMCLGSTLALLELKLVIAMILKRWRVTVPAGARIDVGGPMLAEPRNGLPVVIGAPSDHAARVKVRGNIRRVVDLD